MQYILIMFSPTPSQFSPDPPHLSSHPILHSFPLSGNKHQKKKKYKIKKQEETHQNHKNQKSNEVKDQ